MDAQLIPKETVERLLRAISDSDSINIDDANFITIDSDGEIQAFETKPSYCGFTSEWTGRSGKTLANIGRTKYANAMLFQLAA